MALHVEDEKDEGHGGKMQSIFDLKVLPSSNNIKQWFGQNVPHAVQQRIGIIGDLNNYYQGQLGCKLLSNLTNMNMNNRNYMAVHIPLSTILEEKWNTEKTTKCLKSLPIEIKIKNVKTEIIVEVAADGTFRKYLKPGEMEKNEIFPLLVSSYSCPIIKLDDISPFIRINFGPKINIAWNGLNDISGSIGLIKSNQQVYQHIIVCEETGKEPKSSITIFYDNTNKDQILVDNKNVDYWWTKFQKMINKLPDELTKGELFLSLSYFIELAKAKLQQS